MRQKESETDRRALWDPLWEFILDDHDSVDEYPTRRKTRSRSRRTRGMEREPSLLDVFFENESEYSEGDDVSVKSGVLDSRDESNVRRSKDRSASKRRSQLTENGGVDNSMWDFFGTGHAENDSKKIQKIQTRQIIQTEVEPKANKKGGIFRRFRRKDSEDERSTISSKKKRQVRVTVTEANQTKPEKVIQTKKAAPQKSDGMDPFQLFMEVAGRLDPFASDHDSDSEGSASMPGNRTQDDTDAGTDFGTDQYTDATDSVAEMDRLVEQARANHVNEIRLNFTPIRYKSGKEGYNLDEIGASAQEKQAFSMDQDEEIPEELEENSLAMPAPRARINGVGAITTLDTIDEDPWEESPLQPETSAFQPILGAKSKPSQGRDRMVKGASLIDLADSGEGRKFGLKRLACWRSAKTQELQESNESYDKIPKEMALSLFPATRMVSDNADDSPKVTADSSSHGVMGVSPDHFAETKGPQSLYAYDYQTQQHMDVFYTAMGMKPRSSIVVRKLGGPPPLMPSASRNEVIVQVEASTVSETDCIIRQGYWWGSEMAPLANTPGVDVVGKIFQLKPHIGTQFGLQASQTVLSLIKWGGNSRYVAVDPAKLVKVPIGVDPAEAACLPEMYLTAFQVLHFGQSGQIRYDRSALRGKSVLIVGSMANNMGKAIIELALHAGVANIYATAKQKHWKTLISFGIMPLSQEPLEWIARLEGTIDLVLASNGGLREDVTPTHYRALRPRTGRLIMCGRRVVGNDLPAGDWEHNPTTLVCAKQKEFTKMMHRSHSYDVFEQWDKCLEMCKKDLEHLLELLQRGIIKPTILDRIPLSKVARAHELLETKRLSGFLICEPWMRSKKRAVYL